MKIKLLKLDARFEDARRVARCLMDSPIKSVVGENYLRGITNYYGIDSMIRHGFVTSCLHVEKEIKLPIDTLKFCPFTAMREGVEVFHQETDQCGLIESIICGREVWLTKEGDESSVPFGVNDLKLGLYQIERGELEGCEIVEVGE